MELNIYEAATQALESGKHMKRNSWRIASVSVTRLEYCFGDTKYSDLRLAAAGGAWKPHGEDILANDWELVEPQSDTEPRREERTENVQKSVQPCKCNKLRVITFALAIISLMVSIVALLTK